MFLRNFNYLAVTAVLFLLGGVPAALAQQTSSSIQGTVVDSAGVAVAGAPVTILHEPSSTTKQVTTNESGRFAARGLRVGGPYKVTVSTPSYQTHVQEDIFLTLGDAFRLQVTLNSGEVEEIVVLGEQLQVAQVASGPSSTFNLADLASAPAVNRDIKDVIRVDPRIHIDVSEDSAIQCGGGNPRFNSLTVDGVRMNDNFGLNRNGYPTERLPISFDAISQVAVELAPFDVQYGGFSACNINAVTKSGDNEVHGSFFMDYTGDAISGDKIEGDSIDIGSFDNIRYGINVGAPIIEDKLFIFAAYEKLNGDQVVSTGPEGSGSAVPVPGVSQAEADRVAQIARDVYGYDPGSSFPGSFGIDDEKLLVKLDWNINDDHRAAFTYNYNDGFSVQEADDEANRLEFEDHYYTRSAELTAYIGQVFSNWTDNFSTEFKLGYSELKNQQISIGGTDLSGQGGNFGEVQIRDDGGSVIYLGSDDSRHSNRLSYDTLNFKFAGTYEAGDHTILAGIESEEFDVSNLFIQHTQGEYRFGSIDDFESQTPFRITYDNTVGSNNPDDAAGEFSYRINTLYLQDKWFVTDALELTLGLRYDWYKSSDLPVENQDFIDNFGFSNSQNLDGLDLLQPRIAFNWDINDNVEVHGGVGLYSGGNPNVWIGNSYGNNGSTVLRVEDKSGAALNTLAFDGTGRPIFDIPQALLNEVDGGQGGGFVSATDPNFEIPSEWKFSLGTSFSIGNDYLIALDVLHSERKDAAIIVNPAYERSGQLFDGRETYTSIPTATTLDADDETVGFPRTGDLLLTNVDGDSGESTTFSIGVSKSWDFGLDASFGYAYNKSEDVNPMRSSVHFSNYTQLPTAARNNPQLATSNYEIPHRFTLNLSYDKDFFSDYTTSFTLFGIANKGRPYSYTMDGRILGDDRDCCLTGIFIDDAASDLLYVPTGLDDPNVVFGAGFDTEAFFAFVDSQGLSRGQIVGRNELNASWFTRFDLRIDQQIPGIAGNPGNVFFTINNIANLLNDDWGVQTESSSPSQSVATVSLNTDTGQYVFDRFDNPAGQTVVQNTSLWSAQIGFKFEF